jgi:hypothetical protein
MQQKHEEGPASMRQQRWVLTIDSREAAVNLYSILMAFRKSEGTGFIDRESARHITRWLKAISEQVPGVKDLADDTRGPFRKRDLSSIDATLELGPRERNLMLTICKLIHGQLTTPKGKRDWIENQGRADYELAVKNFQTWVNSLEGEGMSESR